MDKKLSLTINVHKNVITELKIKLLTRIKLTEKLFFSMDDCNQFQYFLDLNQKQFKTIMHCSCPLCLTINTIAVSTNYYFPAWTTATRFITFKILKKTADENYALFLSTVSRNQ